MIFLPTEKEAVPISERFGAYFQGKYGHLSEGAIRAKIKGDAGRNEDWFLVDVTIDPWTFGSDGASFAWEGPWRGKWCNLELRHP